jgi:hypothetical protein
MEPSCEETLTGKRHNHAVELVCMGLGLRFAPLCKLEVVDKSRCRRSVGLSASQADKKRHEHPAGP